MRISTLGSGTGERMADAQVLLQVRPVRARPQTMAGLAWWRFARHRMAVVGLLVVALLAAASALAPWLSPYDPDKPHLQLQLGHRRWCTRWAPTTWGVISSHGSCTEAGSR